MKKLLLFFLPLLPSFVHGQFSFLEVPFSTALTNYDCSIYPVNYAKISHGDVNGDGFNDILVSGDGDNSDYDVQLYLNNGTGNLINAGMSFPGASFLEDNEIIDLNNDGKLDLVVSGGSIYVYLNNGFASFTLSGLNALNVQMNAELDFADVDSDGDQDMIAQGRSSNLTYVTELYLNDGFANFSAQPGTNFLPLVNGSVEFFEFDNDGDPDLILSGFNSGTRYTKFYTNDGNGNFTDSTIVNGMGVGFSTMNVLDLNNDGLEEILMTGEGWPYSTSIIKNDGSGNCVMTPIDLPSMYEGGVASADIENDGDIDLMMTGNIGTGFCGKLFRNDGTNQFVRETNTPFMKTFRGDVEFVDLDNDSDLDLCIVGSIQYGNEVAEVYLNDGQGNFQSVSSQPFGINEGDAHSGDIDNDGDEDILLMGHIGFNVRQTKLFINDGTGIFSMDVSGEFEGLTGTKIVLKDLNNDSDLDIILCGSNGYEFKTYLYDNDGFGNFTAVQNMPFENFDFMRVFAEDLDNDGLPELLMYNNFSSTSNKKLYRNLGSYNFQEITNDPILEMDFANAGFADVDNDGDLDAFISGELSSTTTAKIYLNNGNCSFIAVSSNSFFALSSSTINFTDYDMDGDQDLYYSGTDNNLNPNGRLYLNNGNGNFEMLGYQPFEFLYYETISFYDLDNDGDGEAILSGNENSGENFCNLYNNLGNGSFFQIGDPFPNVTRGNFTFGDYNNDTKPDVLITGSNSSGYNAKLYFNKTNIGINENQIDSDFQIYPNPTDGVINVLANTSMIDKSYEIVNSIGSVILKGKINATQLMVNVTNFESGLYFVRIEGFSESAYFMKK